jgi:hypothetical protein
LQKGEEGVSVIVLGGVPPSILHTQLAINFQKFLEDPMSLSLPYVVQLDASPDAFSHFMEILNGSEPQVAPQIADDLLLWSRAFGHHGLLATFAP